MYKETIQTKQKREKKTETGLKYEGENNLKDKRKRWKEWREERQERLVSDVREKGRGGGDRQKNERDKKRGDCFESCRSVRIESQAASCTL